MISSISNFKTSPSFCAVADFSSTDIKCGDSRREREMRRFLTALGKNKDLKEALASAPHNFRVHAYFSKFSKRFCLGVFQDKLSAARNIFGWTFIQRIKDPKPFAGNYIHVAEGLSKSAVSRCGFIVAGLLKRAAEVKR